MKVSILNPLGLETRTNNQMIGYFEVDRK